MRRHRRGRPRASPSTFRARRRRRERAIRRARTNCRSEMARGRSRIRTRDRIRNCALAALTGRHLHFLHPHPRQPAGLGRILDLARPLHVERLTTRQKGSTRATTSANRFPRHGFFSRSRGAHPRARSPAGTRVSAHHELSRSGASSPPPGRPLRRAHPHPRAGNRCRRHRRRRQGPRPRGTSTWPCATPSTPSSASSPRAPRAATTACAESPTAKACERPTATATPNSDSDSVTDTDTDRR